MIAYPASEIKTTSNAFFRCPGCFAWTPQLNAIYYPPNSLDDWWDYDLCPRCDLILKLRNHIGQRCILDNIGCYAGWSDEADTL